MDSIQDPFTRRMLQRAASVRRNREGSLRFSLDDSRRKICILQAIGDKPVKIADAADCRIGSEKNPNSIESVFAGDKQRTLRGTRLTSSDSLISRQSRLSGLCPRTQSSSSNLASESKSDADCENVHDLQRFSNQNADPLKRGEKDRSRRNSQVLKLETPAHKEGKYYETGTENYMSENEFIEKVMAFSRPDKPPRSQNGGTKDVDSNSRSKFKETGNSTHPLDQTSLNLTGGNLTKESMTSSTYTKGFELGNVKWRGPLYSASVRSQKKENEDSFGKKFDIEPSPKLYNIAEPELVKVKQTEIWTPSKMRAELKMIGSCNKPEVQDSVEDNSRRKRPDKLSLHLNDVEGISKLDVNGATLENSSSAVTPLTAEIIRLEAEIKRLELHPDFQTPENPVQSTPPNQLYPNLFKIQFTPTGYSPKKPSRSPRSSEDPPECSTSSKPGVTSNQDNLNFEKDSNSKTNDDTKDMKNLNHLLQDSKKEIDANKFAKNNNTESEKVNEFQANTESSRKSSLTDHSKNTSSPGPRESSVSSVTISPETPKTLLSAETSSPPGEKNITLESTVPYDVDNFLADALGDELYNTTMTYPPSEGHEKSISQFNASELISEERTPLDLGKKKRLLKKVPMTEPPPQHSSTFNRTMTIYRSLTARIKKRLRPGLRMLPPVATNDSAMTSESMLEDKKIQALIQQANIQHTLMYQANKALTFCRSMKEFAASTEQVESEKSLLLAGLRRAAALEEIKNLDCELNNNENELYGETGEVTIKDFSLPLKEDVLKCEAQTGDFVQWFVIVVFHRETVWASKAVSCPIQSPRIIFNGGFSVSNLTPNFKITVKIYSLKLRRITYNYDDKYRLNQAEKLSRCPSPKKLIGRKSDKSLSPREIRQIEFSAIRNTSFVLSGMVELYLHDLSLTSPWPLTSLLPGSVLQGTIDLSLSCKLHLSVSHAGFLTHGDEAGGLATWNRRWCVLRGQTLKFWNYPCDQEDKEPLAVIDLTNCISKEINVVDRSLCAKPRTLLIETARRRSILDRNSMLLECRLSCTIVRNLLCCDTARDFNQWKSKLNHIVSALRDWNVTNRCEDVQVSDL